LDYLTETSTRIVEFPLTPSLVPEIEKVKESIP